MPLSIASLQPIVAKAQPKERQRVEEIGDRVADARRRLGVRLRRDILAADLAKMAGVPSSTVTRVESGETKPNEQTVERLAKALQVTPAYLRYGLAAEPTPVIPVKAPDAGKGE